MRKILALLATVFVLTAPGSLAAEGQQQPDLQSEVARAILGYSQYGIFDDVRIAVDGGTVTLSGRVTMPFKRDAIAERVDALATVTTVVNQIGVLPASLSDTRLRRAVAQAIYTHPSFWHYASMAHPPIHIIVEHGRVTLTGVVTSQTDRMLAFALAQVDGALGVANEILLEE